MVSDRDRLEDELEQIELFLTENEIWTPLVSDMYIRREKIKDTLKSMKGDWLNRSHV